MALLAIVSCEKPNHGAEQKLRKLEQQAAEAVERQKQLERELGGNCGPVKIYGAFINAELIGDLIDEFSLNHFTEHFMITFGQ